jgi:uncharacterized membrane protein YphA (DoxX/SURF4 family)
LLISRLILGEIFLFASIDKILHPDQFAQIVYNYKLLPDAAVNPFAIVFPWLEALCGQLLIAGVWVKENAAILALMLLMFIGAIGINLARGLDFNCGCMTTSAEGSSDPVWLLVRDVALLLPAVHILARSAAKKENSA